jgi:hypothetical protein
MFGVPSRRRTAANLGSWAGAIAVLLAAALAVHGQENKQDNAPSVSKPDAARAAWARIVMVLQHPRCMNCHQDNVPLQGDERRIHIPLVVRGHTNDKGVGLGVDAMRCGNCHNATGNNETSGTPGAVGEPWGLAPISMRWQGRSSAYLCDMLKDRTRNGNRDGPSLILHMSTPVVMWAWVPGGDRTPVPMPHEEFVKQMEIWVAGDMACPTN